jgi:hypothetical protein
MNKPLLGLCLISLTALSACDYHDSALDKPPGTYTTHTTRTDQYGTKYDQDQTTDVMVGPDGNKRAVVRTKDSADPKGLFNKNTNESTVIEQER